MPKAVGRDELGLLYDKTEWQVLVDIRLTQRERESEPYWYDGMVNYRQTSIISLVVGTPSMQWSKFLCIWIFSINKLN